MEHAAPNSLTAKASAHLQVRRTAAGFAIAIACAVMSVTHGQPVDAAASAFKTSTWDDLVPKDWDPMKAFRDKNVGATREGSSAELAMTNEMRAAWDNAPTRGELDGARIRLPGYVVPLDASRGELKQFLLVPYFGACIHSPPPPANQIVHVLLDAPKTLRTMDVVWVSGTLKTQRQDSPMGVSGYSMRASTVEPYKEPAK
jgi:hypothetical protein